MKPTKATATTKLPKVVLAGALPSTLYIFELTVQTGDPYFELNSTQVEGYAGGGYFRGGNNGALDADGVLTAAPSGGDMAFHVGLSAIPIPEPSAALLGSLDLVALLRRRR